MPVVPAAELPPAAAPAPVEVPVEAPPAPVEAPPAPVEIPPVEIPPVASAPPAVEPEPAAEALKSAQEYMREMELPQAQPSGPFGLSLPSAPKLPDFGAAAGGGGEVASS